MATRVRGWTPPVDSGGSQDLQREVPLIPVIPLIPIILLFLAGCIANSEPPADPVESAFAASLPVDFVVVIDNSRSITAREQVLVRETTMLLADLTDVGDFFSVVTFGSGSELVATTEIRTDQDKLDLKARIRLEVDFGDNRSDIHAGIRLVAERRNELFRPPGTSKRAVILLTDGRLEPSTGEVRDRFDELRADLAGPLARTEVYAVVLGDGTSRRPILTFNGQTVTGLVLMEEFVARSRDLFFHATSLDQLFEIAILILKQVKGVSSLGEAGATEFKVDDTVESLTLIVPKRTAEGEILHRSGDLELSWRGESGQSEDVGARQGLSIEFGTSSIYWSDDFEYFDLFIVQDPHPGLWDIRLASGDDLDVLSTIETPIDLRHNARSYYYRNEGAAIITGLYDSRSSEFSRSPYQVMAQVTLAENPESSGTSVSLPVDTASGQFSMDAPSALVEMVGATEDVRAITLEFVAQRWSDSTRTSFDPWFIRHSAPVTIEVLEPFTEWTRLAEQMTKVPLLARMISYSDFDLGASTSFGSTLESAPSSGEVDGERYPTFDAPPRLRITVERWEEEAGGFETYFSETIDSDGRDGGEVLSSARGLDGPGRYRYAYTLEGTTAQGPFVLRSPWFYTTIRFGLELWALTVVLFGLVLRWPLDRMAKLKGTIQQVAPTEENSESLRGRVKKITVGEATITLQAGLSPFFTKRIRATVKKGAVKINSRDLMQGDKPHTLPRQNRGEHTIVELRTSDTGTERGIEQEIKNLGVRLL